MCVRSVGRRRRRRMNPKRETKGMQNERDDPISVGRIAYSRAGMDVVCAQGVDLGSRRVIHAF